jgi:sugar phosphate isomerase/epimerase
MTTPMTEVALLFYEGRIEHWLRFGTQERERILDRRRRVIAFAPSEIFAFVRWEANDYGTVLSRLDILGACGAAEVVTTVPGVTPGGEILLRLEGWPRVKRALATIAAIEELGINPAEVAPDWWRHLHNRIVCNLPHRPYSRGQHAAWLRRRQVAG